MKLTELFEMVTAASVTSGDIGGFRDRLFKREIKRDYIVDVSTLFKKKKPKISRKVKK